MITEPRRQHYNSLCTCNSQFTIVPLHTVRKAKPLSLRDFCMNLNLLHHQLLNSIQYLYFDVAIMGISGLILNNCLLHYNASSKKFFFIFSKINWIHFSTLNACYNSCVGPLLQVRRCFLKFLVHHLWVVQNISYLLTYKAYFKCKFLPVRITWFSIRKWLKKSPWADILLGAFGRTYLTAKFC